MLFFEWRFEGIDVKARLQSRARLKSLHISDENLNLFQRTFTNNNNNNNSKTIDNNKEEQEIESSNYNNSKSIFKPYAYFSRKYSTNLGNNNKNNQDQQIINDEKQQQQQQDQNTEPRHHHFKKDYSVSGTSTATRRANSFVDPKHNPFEENKLKLKVSHDENLHSVLQNPQQLPTSSYLTQSLPSSAVSSINSRKNSSAQSLPTLNEKTEKSQDDDNFANILTNRNLKFEEPVKPSSIHTDTSNNNHHHHHHHHFHHPLPQPYRPFQQRKRRGSVQPADIAKSIDMMSKLHPWSSNQTMNNEPPLVINNPLQAIDSNEEKEEGPASKMLANYARNFSDSDVNTPKRSTVNNLTRVSSDTGPYLNDGTTTTTSSNNYNSKNSSLYKRQRTCWTSLRKYFPWIKYNWAGKHGVYNTLNTYLSWDPRIQGNSVFVHLTSEQKEELGGIEYRALKLLAKVLIGYYVGWILLSFLFLAPWSSVVSQNSNSSYYAVFKKAAINPVWWAIFAGQSAFNNVGLTLTPDSFLSFAKAQYILVITCLVMIAGYSGFPCMLRLTLWLMQGLTGVDKEIHETVTFLLEHPRRCFTLLFPSQPTWWLFYVILGFNTIDVVFYIVVGLKNKTVVAMSWGDRITTGLFQTVVTRTTGFSAVPLQELHPGLQVLYAIMMYISVFPIAISMRHTNVYEEKSLGVYEEDHSSDEEEYDDYDENDNENEEGGGDATRQEEGVQRITTSASNSKNSSTTSRKANKQQRYYKNRTSKLPRLDVASKSSLWGVHIERQLSFDVWFLFIAFLLLCVTEGGKIAPEYSTTARQDQDPIPLFAILFEVISAYCTVGLSMGYPNTDTSLCAQFSTLGKLIICSCLYRGRHRGLPYAIDRAVLLPSDLHENDADQELRLATPSSPTTNLQQHQQQEQEKEEDQLKNFERTGSSSSYQQQNRNRERYYSIAVPPNPRRLSSIRKRRRRQSATFNRSLSTNDMRPSPIDFNQHPDRQIDGIIGYSTTTNNSQRLPYSAGTN